MYQVIRARCLTTARSLAQAALRDKLVACVNLVPKIESHYRWQGELQVGTEVLMLLKTTQDRISALEKLVMAKHPYDTPEFVVLPLEGGNKRYLDWWRESVEQQKR